MNREAQLEWVKQRNALLEYIKKKLNERFQQLRTELEELDDQF
ncbi:hypothetical protein MKX73_10650 [Solibacillus sp. FSL W7-1436]